jgi:cytochrome c-type biogenesis protein CcmH/NrfG
MARKKKSSAPRLDPVVAGIFLLAAMAVGFYLGTLYQGSRQASAPIPSAAAPQAAANQEPDLAPRIAAAEAKTKTDPKNPEAWSELGNLYFDADQPAKAVAAYEKSLEFKPGNPDVLTDMGVMYRHLNLPLRAVESFDAALAKNPVHIIAVFNKAIVLLHDLGKPDEALKTLQALKAKKPDAILPGGRKIDDLIQEFGGAPKTMPAFNR